MKFLQNKDFAAVSILTLIFFVVFTKEAYAYLDPGTGSYILQLLVAGALGGLFAIKTFWRQLVSFLTNLFSKKKRVRIRKKKNGQK
ncbi:MAG TPA: hypothetical protein VF303_03130 [Candidatus Nanoarchaeia archaeon]